MVKKPATVKAEETRERILDSALKLFRDRGFDDTTMRDIAAEAGVATGAAYYYFRSKEDLVMAFYVRTADEARQLWPDVIGTGRNLHKRLRAIIDLKFDQFAKHRRLLVALVRTGIDPTHPLSPFGRETEPMREESIDAFRMALDGSSTGIPKDIQSDLPRLLWLYQMGLILFWMYDESPKQERTRKLVDGSLDLVVRLIQISALPLMGPLRKRMVDVLRAVD
ncbi:MAG: TetR family transcriptional regulator [Thermoanaerobaculia bacterium]